MISVRKKFDYHYGASPRYFDAAGVTHALVGFFRGLDIPFDGSACPQLSPVHALDLQWLKNLRLNGHYSSVEAAVKYVLPKGYFNARKPNYPQDAVASLLQRLFPSNAGLVVNTHDSHRINKYLLPGNIADVFAAVYTDDDFDLKEDIEREFAGIKTNEAVLKLVQALLPEKLKKRFHQFSDPGSKNRISEEDKSTYKYLIELASLILSAFKDPGYPPYTVEKILTAYMWERNKADTENLKPYYEGLAKAGMIDKKLVADMKWNQEYYAESTAETKLEQKMLTKIYEATYKKNFPAGVHYGTSHIIINDKKVPYSDCGDSILNSLFMMFLYNPETRKFDTTKLRRLEKKGYKISPKLLKYFEKFCDCPSAAESPKMRKKWSKVVNSLNKPGDKYKVRYISPEDEEEKFYGIDAGVDNILRVIGKLLGAPEDEFDMEMKDKYSCAKNLDKLCYLFSDIADDKEKPGIDDKYWSVKSVRHQNHRSNDIEELFETVPTTGWYDLSLVFSYGGSRVSEKGYLLGNVNREKVFELEFDAIHFDFNRLDNDYIFDNVKRRWDTLHDVYSSPMDTIEERIRALEKMLMYRKTFQSDEFKYTLKAWLNPLGDKFFGWRNPKMNAKVANVLLQFMSVDEILNLHIPQFMNRLVENAAEHGNAADLKKIMAEDLKYFQSSPPQPHRNKYSNMARILDHTLKFGKENAVRSLVEAGANEYMEKVSGVSLLHMIAYAGNLMIASCPELLAKFGKDFNAKTSDGNGNTPLHFAAKASSVPIIDCVLRLGARVNEKNDAGQTALYIVAEQLEARLAKSSLIQKLNFFKIIDATFILELMIEKLIEYGADFNTEFKNGKTYLQWAQENNLKYAVKAMLQHMPAHVVSKDNYSNNHIINSLIPQ